MDDLLNSWLARLERWVGLHPVSGSPALAQVAEEIVAVLADRGFIVERHPHPSGDLLVARLRAEGPRLGLYGHYDVEPGGTNTLQVVEGRVYGRGVGDNLGPLALRLSVLERSRHDLDLLWVIEPGEEVGSLALADWIGETTAPRVDLWLDETGYFEADGRQRVLLADPDERALDLAKRCAVLAAAAGRQTLVERRRLHRVVRDGRFSVEALFRDTPYLALGPNDDLSDVHGGNESLPLDTIELSVHQLESLLELYSGEPLR